MLVLAVILFFAFILQFFLPEFPGLGGEILIFPLIFFYVAAALPLWGMLAIAFVSGLMWDCVWAVPVDAHGHPELFFGWSILLYGGLGAVMNGLHPLFLRGKWPVHCLAAGILTSVLVLIEYVILTFRREPFSLIWSADVWRKILGSGLASALLAPPLFLGLNWIGRRLGHFERPRVAESS